jgi:dTDP-D-glucose 4,6-dehydratase
LFSFVNFDKLAYGASATNVTEHIRTSGRYSFINANLLDQSIVETVLRQNQVYFPSQIRNECGYNIIIVQIDTIVHFAAITHVDESYADRDGTINENIMATVRYALHSLNFKRLNIFSAYNVLFQIIGSNQELWKAEKTCSHKHRFTLVLNNYTLESYSFLTFQDEVYGDSSEGSEPKTESSPLNPTNPYAASKAACELIITSYHVCNNIVMYMKCKPQF